MFPAGDAKRTEAAYKIAKERYGELGVDTDKAIKTLRQIPISLHCWQGDDVKGFEGIEALDGGGIAAIGNYPGRARTGDELRGDLAKAYSLIPGKHRLNFHALYLETGGKIVDRDAIEPEHFRRWIDWIKEQELDGADFNQSVFAHPKADSGFTLSSRDKGIRDFWIEHSVRCRRIGAHIGKEVGSTCITNLWIPDGMKDIPADRYTPRELLLESLDKIFEEKIDERYNKDAVECKLFGLGSESYVAGSHEFYMGYAISRDKILTLDAGHFHPTETIADKISSVLLYVKEVLLHVSRGVRWDSDHVVTLTDDLQAIMQEIIRGNYLERVHIGLDFFDASINRVGAWAIGTRNALRGLLLALLEPIDELRRLEQDGDFTARLALLEELKGLPFGAVWDYHCLRQEVPAGMGYVTEIRQYEKDVLATRS